MNSTYLVWFCGTGEKEQDVKHLFQDLPQDSYTIIPGWGTGHYMSGERTFDWKAQLSGIDKSDAIKALTGLISALSHVSSAIHQGEIKKLIVGGFSRGPAFFVPYYLKILTDDSSRPLVNLDKLAILLLDPVTGSAHDDNKDDITESTMSSLKILNKLKLLEDLTHQIRDHISIISLIPGFDKRKKNFRPDTSFLSALAFIQQNQKAAADKISTYIYRAGITHSVFSTYSEDKKKREVPDITLNLEGFDDALDLSTAMIQERFDRLLSTNLDLVMTRQLLISLFKENTQNDNYWQKLKEYQDITTQVLECAKKINYDLGKIYWTDGNNDNYVSTEIRRLIQPTENLDALVALLAAWHMV